MPRPSPGLAAEKIAEEALAKAAAAREETAEAAEASLQQGVVVAAGGWLAMCIAMLPGRPLP